MSTTAQRLRDYLSDHLSQMVDLIRELVLAESPTLSPDTQQKVFDILARFLKQEAGYSSQFLPGSSSGGMLLAQPKSPGDGRKQLILGHSDTVWPVGTLRKMPWTIDNNAISGPGVYDMKAGLAQMAFALKAIHTLELRPPLTPLVLINSDEETGSRDSTKEIGRLARQCKRAWVVEPSLGSEGRLKTRRKGVGIFQFQIHGKAAHAGLEPEAGRSAILELSYVIQKLFKLNDPEKGVSVNVGRVEGGIRPNVIAPESTAEVDFRVLHLEDGHSLERAIRELEPETPGVTLGITGGLEKAPMEDTPRNQALWKMALEAGHELGLQLEQGLAGGASDGNTTSLYTATLDGLGAVGGGAHASHEFVYLDRLVERSALLALLLLSEAPA